MEGEALGTRSGRRWEFGPGRALHGHASLHSTRSVEHPVSSGLIEIHAVPARQDTAGLVADLEGRVALVDPAVLNVLDVGIITPSEENGTAPEPAERVFVVTERWDQLVGRDPMPEDELVAVAEALSAGLAAIHRTGRVHGAVHRGAVRRIGDGWRLADAGLAPLLSTETAAYRPPGLNVMESPSPAADMWNLGVLLHELGNGRLLRPGEEPSVPGAPRITGLLRDLLQRDPSDRPAADQVTAHLAGVQPATAGGAGAIPVGGGRGPDATTRGDDAADGVPAPSGGDGPAAPAPPTRAIGPIETDETPIAPIGARPSGRRRAGILVAVGAVLAVAVAVTAFAIRSGGDDEGPLEGFSVDRGASSTGTTADTTTSTSTTTTAGSAPRRGDIALADLMTGDCIAEQIEQGDVIKSAEVVACDEAHASEVMSLETPPTAGDGAAYPGRRPLVEFGQQACPESFETYVGADALLTVLIHQVIVPSFDEWDGGERQAVVCLVARFDGTPLDRSVAGAFLDYQIIDGATTSVGKLTPSNCFDLPEGGEFEPGGKRQDVIVVICTEAHRYEVVGFGLLPVEPADEEELLPTPARFIEFAEFSRDDCRDQWAALTPQAGIAEPAVLPNIPDVYDWSQGDRFYTCIAEWEEPVFGSAVLANGFSEQEGDGDEGDGDAGDAGDG